MRASPAGVSSQSGLYSSLPFSSTSFRKAVNEEAL